MSGNARRAQLRRIVWFVGLWIAGVAAVTVVGYGIRFALGL